MVTGDWLRTMTQRRLFSELSRLIFSRVCIVDGQSSVSRGNGASGKGLQESGKLFLS